MPVKKSTKKYKKIAAAKKQAAAIKKTKKGMLVHGMFEIDFSPLDSSENVDIYVNAKGEKFFKQMKEKDETFDPQAYLTTLVHKTMEEILRRTP